MKILAEFHYRAVDPAGDEALREFIARRKAALTDTIEDE